MDVIYWMTFSSVDIIYNNAPTISIVVCRWGQGVCPEEEEEDSEAAHDGEAEAAVTREDQGATAEAEAEDTDAKCGGWGWGRPSAVDTVCVQ